MINDAKIQSLLKIPRMGFNSSVYSNENNLIGLLDLINYHKLFDKNIVEIGCFLGVSTELFALFCKQVTTVDIWGSDNSYDGGECPKDYWPLVEKTARERLSNYKNVNIVKDSSLNFNLQCPDNSLDLVYIDGNHSYDSVKFDMAIWYNKIKDGGVLSGHDYNPGSVVIKAVDDFFKLNQMKDFKVFADNSWSMIK